MADTVSFVPASQLFAMPRAAGHTVCASPGQSVAWAELASRIAAVAAALATRPERRWLIAAEDALEFCTALLGTLYAGKRAVIAPNLGAGTLRDLALAYDASIGSAIVADVDPAKLTRDVASPSPIDSNAAVLDLYTSGSTGVPKRVTKLVRQLEAELQVLESCWGSALRGVTVVSTVAHHHIYGLLFRLLWPLCAGRAFDPTLYAEPSNLLHAIETHGDVALISSPAHLSRLPELVALEALRGSVRCIFTSGAPLPAAVAQRFHRAVGQAPIEVYGSTETGGIGWRQRFHDADAELWTAFPGIEFLGAGSDDRRLRSPYLDIGVDARLDDDIELVADGRFRLGARLDRIVKVEGKRLSLPDMEQHLRQHPWIADAAVIVLRQRRDEVCAAIMLRDSGHDELQRDRRAAIGTLRAFLHAWYDAVVLPKRWRFVDALPLDARGKTSAADLRALFEPATTAALPPIRAERPGLRRIELEFELPSNLPCFDGHFPGLPVLPGVIQIDWAIRLGRERLGCAGRFRAVENLRFSSVVVPERTLTLLLETNADATRLSFRYMLGERKCSSGTIVFEP